MSDAAPGAATALRATPNSKPSNTLTVADTPAAQTPRPHVRAAPPGTSAYARPDHAPFFQEKETPGFFKCTADWRGQLWGLAGAVVGGLVGLTLGPIGSAALSVGLAVLMGGVAAKRHQRHQQRDIQQENTVRRALDDALNDTFDPARAPVALSALQQFVTQLAPAFKTPFRKEIASVLHGALLPLLMSESTSPDVKESVKALLEVLGKLSTLEAKGSASRKLAPKVKEFLAAADTARENASSAASKPPTPGATKQNDLVPVSGRTQRTPMALNGQPTVGAGTKPVSSLSGYAHAPRHPPVAPPLPSAAPGYSAAARAA